MRSAFTCTSVTFSYNFFHEAVTLQHIVGFANTILRCTSLSVSEKWSPNPVILILWNFIKSKSKKYMQLCNT